MERLLLSLPAPVDMAVEGKGGRLRRGEFSSHLNRYNIDLEGNDSDNYSG